MSDVHASPTQEVCSVQVGDTLYGVPIAHVLEILGKPATQPVPLAPYFVGGLVHYRGEVLTVLGVEAWHAPTLQSPDS